MPLFTRSVARSTALFVWTLSVTIALLFVFAEVATPIVQRTKIEHTLPVHKTLYLERALSDEQMYHILNAAMEWNQVTNGQVVFDIKRLPDANMQAANAIVMFNVTPDFPDIIILDSIKHYSTLGYYNARGLEYIAMVDERITSGSYDAVVMHELGHALGLEHPDLDDPKIGIGTLMYSLVDAGSNHITDEDLKRFCKLYHCDASKFHGLP